MDLVEFLTVVPAIIQTTLLGSFYYHAQSFSIRSSLDSDSKRDRGRVSVRVCPRVSESQAPVEFNRSRDWRGF